MRVAESQAHVNFHGLQLLVKSATARRVKVRRTLQNVKVCLSVCLSVSVCLVKLGVVGLLWHLAI